MGLIRVILALSVVITHVGPIFGFELLGGPTAVESFYIISGFYMSLILNEKYVGKTGSYKLFLTNRLLRLFPIYWVVLLITVVVCLSFAFHSHGTYWSKLQPFVDYGRGMSFSSIFLLIFSNVFLVGQDIVMFLGLNSKGHLIFMSNFWNSNPPLFTFLLVPQAWTIGLEITFYLVAPFLVRRKLRIVLTLITISLAIRLFLIHVGFGDDPWNYRFFPSELLFFLLGNLGYKFFKKIENTEIKRVFLLAILSCLLLLIFTFSVVHLPQKTFVFFGVFFISLPFIFKLTKNNGIDSSIGDLSYPIYLSHTLIITILKDRMTSIANTIGEGVFVILITLLFSMFLNYLIAKPVERIRQRRVLSVASA